MLLAVVKKFQITQGQGRVRDQKESVLYKVVNQFFSCQFNLYIWQNLYFSLVYSGHFHAGHLFNVYLPNHNNLMSM